MPVALATEDELSEMVGIKLLSEHAVLIENEPLLLRKRGYGYLKSRMESWQQMAEHRMVLVLTDLDDIECPVAMLGQWLGDKRERSPNLLLRIVEREIESWILADHEALAKLLGNKGRLPAQPDELREPKQHLMTLAKKAPRAVRDDLVAQRGAIACQGLGYNRRLVEWVREEWSPERASLRSPSLLRARRAIRAAAENLVR